jgi:hypothetical protein
MKGQRLLSLSAFAVAVASAFGAGVWATRPSFGAKFGPIDDHEPLIWMGTAGRLPWSKFWTTFINHTEVGQWGAAGRFRASYYLLRVGETVVFGNDPWAWYAWVLIMFTAACAILGYLGAIWLATALGGARTWIRWSGVLGGAAFGAFLFAGLYAWSGIVARLGPAEQLGLVATAVALLSLTKVSLDMSRLWWIVALLGVATAVFAKESFSSLVLVFPIVGTYAYLALGRRRIDLAAGILGLLPAVVLGAILGPTLLHGEHDIYGGNVGSSRLTGALDGLVEPPLRRWLLAGAIALLAWAAVALTIPEAQRKVSWFLLAVILWLFACVLIDAWFYGGNYSLPRYRAVTDLVIALLYVGAGCLAVVAIRRGAARSRPVLVLAIAAGAASSISILRLARDARSNLRVTHAVAIDHATTSNEYQQGLSAAMARVAADPSHSFAVVATNGSDYEPAFAVLNEIARRSDNRYREYLIVQGDPETNGLDVLAGISKNGVPSWHTRPIDELGRTRTAVCAFLNEDPTALSGCRSGDGIRIVAEGM